ncbi:coxsackievirus and adenovirus receptor homolog isoform X2 [Anguilla anguilla]|uniref:coxsackievirus and adenovirus receptor homolog isoform X2 n=1 Tax=Anguilla anguilla TaxID=7936 RepID=UPI0015B1CA0D|nr:coxsackievirus and adenovirus receptor homolog isoform X2 [Anguilla anguilla]
MKIILCTFLLCITAVSVFGQSVELNGVKNKSIEFPTKVETSGSLMYSSKVIGRVLGGKLLPLDDPEFKGRVHWDSRTGLFSLSGLRLNDSGGYKVEKDDGKKSVSFSLTVWIPVSKPHVSATRDKYPCKLMCTVERGTGVTLSWYREGEKESVSSSSIPSAPGLDLSVLVERSGIYICEAKNSVGSETSDPFPVGAHCTGGAAGIWKTDGSKMWSLYLVLIVMLCSRLV